ncbi:MAG: hypothetical protein M3Q87_02075 [Actinomycetota bacterium]|nr:hypothetical protein [Actinomycetota bacterium]
MLDSVEFMVKTALATTTDPVRQGDAFVPTTVLDRIESETGGRFDPDEFALEFIHRFIERLSRRSVKNATVAALASQLKQDLQSRITRLQAGTAEVGVEFYAHRDSMLEAGTRMDDLLIGFVNRGAGTASQVTFHLVAHAPYLDGKFLQFDGKEMGAATQILPGDDATFRVVELLMQHEHFRFAVWLALQGSNDEILGSRPITVEITPTYLNGVDKRPKTGPTAKALLTWSRRPGRFALTFRGQPLDPRGPTA